MSFSSLGRKLKLKFGISRIFKLQNFELTRYYCATLVKWVQEAMHNSECSVFKEVLQVRYFCTDVLSTAMTYYMVTQSPNSRFLVLRCHFT
jgi:hypothetical protein